MMSPPLDLADNNRNFHSSSGAVSVLGPNSVQTYGSSGTSSCVYNNLFESKLTATATATTAQQHLSQPNTTTIAVVNNKTPCAFLGSNTSNNATSPALGMYSPASGATKTEESNRDDSSRPTRESVLRRLSEALMRRNLTKIDLSQRDLQPSDANLIKLALFQNKRLHTLKLGYNHLGDEGLITLSSALANSTSITSLDLGFTGVGDAGLEALAKNISSYSNILPLRTLYLAGNSFGTRGALALARIIQFRCCHLKTLHLTGNKIGVDGIRSLARAIAFLSTSPIAAPNQQLCETATGGIEELFLGGTGLGSEGCHAVSDMLSFTPSLRILSLADNNLGDREVTILADAIKQNRLRLPLEALQLSFNRLTCVGVESLMNAVWGSTSLLEIRLDNNLIGDRGAQLVSVVISTVHSLQRVDLGFNSLSATGMRSLMKAVSESTNVTSLSISGNKLDTIGAKAVAYALAYNTSLKYFFMDNCSASHESQRHITAGIVSNSDVKLLAVTGFRIGAVAVTLGLPAELEHWTNEQVLKFILHMWGQMQDEKMILSMNRERDPSLRSSEPIRKPLDPVTVVTVAKKAYDTLGGETDSVRFSRSRNSEPSFYCPVVDDAVMIETDCRSSKLDFCLVTEEENRDQDQSMDFSFDSVYDVPTISDNLLFTMNEVSSQIINLDDQQKELAERKRRNADWLRRHASELQKLSQKPFNSVEMWTLHRHFFSLSIAPNVGMETNDGTVMHAGATAFSFPFGNDRSSSAMMSSEGDFLPNGVTSEPCMSSGTPSVNCINFGPPKTGENIPGGDAATITRNSMPGGLGRKVSYRSLSDAVAAPQPSPLVPFKGRGRKISTVMEEGVSGTLAMQPQSKRARSNMSLISFFSRIKTKLDSFLEKDHFKALVLMRQLRYTELNLFETSSKDAIYTSNDLIQDVENILLDML